MHQGVCPRKVILNKREVSDRLKHLRLIDFASLVIHIHLCWMQKPN